jgi:DNA-directed RNA polymerase subunit RPC12/RpoP
VSQKTTYVCDWCGETAADLERMPDWHLMWTLRGAWAMTGSYERPQDLCPTCWKALEDAVAKLKDERKKAT